MVSAILVAIGAIFTEHVRNDLQMLLLTADHAIYIKRDNGMSIGLLRGYVDDCLFGGINVFTSCIE